MQFISVSEMRALEQKAFANGISELELMERAGKECARLIETKLETRKRSVLIFCGPGNNGGDGLVCARYLKEKNDIFVCIPIEPKTDSAKTNYKRALDSKIIFVELQNVVNQKYDIIVDALLGIGAKLPLHGEIKKACILINSINAYKASIDVPTGMDADTGECDSNAIIPDATICIHAPKTREIKAGKEKTGEIWIADIGL